MPTSATDFHIPSELLFKTKVDYAHLKTFSCLCFASIHDSDKLDPIAIKSLFLGYPTGQKGYFLYNLATHKTFVSRHVIFYEHVFSYSASPSQTITLPLSSTTLPWPADDPTCSTSVPIDDDIHSSSVPAHPPVESHDTSFSEPSTDHHSPISDLPTPASIPIRHSTRVKMPSVRLKDFVVSSAINSSTPTKHNSNLFVSYDLFGSDHRHFINALDSSVKPASYTQAVQHKHWVDEMNKELTALESNHTWTLVHLPPGKKVVGCKWVYKVKFHADGTIERYKSRLVAKGYTQSEGIDDQETFSPVAKMATVRALLAIAAAKSWEVHQLDVNNAFLHRDLLEEVYMALPQGYSPKNTSGKVCKLQKSLYGLKQASRQWFAKLTEALLQLGFAQSHADYSLFIKSTDSTFTAALVYVDDIIVTGTDPSAIESFKQFLDAQFSIKNLGLIKYYLGIEVTRSSQGFYLS